MHTSSFLRSLSVCLLLAGTAQAQFPMGGMPGNRSQQQPAAIPGTASDAPKGNGRLTGFVIDSAATRAIEFASVAVYRQADNKAIEGAVADAKGKFTISNLPEGLFKVMVTFIGYETKTISDVRLTNGQTRDLGVIRLTGDVRTLQEVTVTGQKALIEEKVDRLVFNAERDITAKGGDATEILRKVPMLSVDLDGNVQLRGSSNVRVLINGKPSTIMAQSVADALKQIPADMIKTVEVITAPSARYDAEGSGGIINIVTKKNNLQGLTLNIDAGVGLRGSNLGLNGNYRRGKLGISLGGFGRSNYNTPGKFENEQTTFLAGGGVAARTTQAADTRNWGMFGRYRLGLDYDLSKTEVLTASLSYGTRGANNTQQLITSIYQGTAATPLINSHRNVITRDNSGTFDGNLDYVKTFKPQKELSLSAQYSRNNRNNNFIADILNGSIITSREKNLNPSFNQETTFQADYQTPIGKNQLIEVGGKTIFRQVESDYTYLIAARNSDNFVENTSRPSNTLNYGQNVMAGYASYQFSTRNKWNIKAGARYEYTAIDARFSNATDNLDIPNYSNLVPSVNISKNIGGITYRLSYNRRLQRPGIQSLNPNLIAANPQNASIGNPFLGPELTDNFELNFSVNVGKVYLNLSPFYSYTGNSIEQVRGSAALLKAAFPGTPFGNFLNTAINDSLVGGAVLTTSANIGRQNRAGLNLFANVNITPKWQLGGGGDVVYLSMTNNSPNAALRASNAGMVIGARVFTNATLKNNWAVQGFAFMRGRQVQLQGIQGGFGFYSLGVRKDFGADRRGGIGLAAENFFNFNGFKIRSEFNSSTFSQKSVATLYNLGFRLTFNYRIGKMSFQEPQRRRGKGINNDDVKDGGGNDQQGTTTTAAPAVTTPRRNR